MQATKISMRLNAEETGLVRTSAMGGGIAKQQIANINEDIDDQCNYCNNATSTASHIRWACTFFDDVRTKVDPLLAKAPLRYLLQCIQCGIAPAMKTKGNATYWGQDFLDDTDDNVKKLLGHDITLETDGTDADETDARQQALEMIQDPSMQGLNARQLMLRQKHAHGSGLDLEFPDEDDINETHREATQ